MSNTIYICHYEGEEPEMFLETTGLKLYLLDQIKRDIWLYDDSDDDKCDVDSKGFHSRTWNGIKFYDHDPVIPESTTIDELIKIFRSWKGRPEDNDYEEEIPLKIIRITGENLKVEDL